MKVSGNSIVRFFKICLWNWRKINKSRELIRLLFGCLVSHSSRNDFECITSGYPLRDYQVWSCSPVNRLANMCCAFPKQRSVFAQNNWIESSDQQCRPNRLCALCCSAMTFPASILLKSLPDLYRILSGRQRSDIDLSKMLARLRLIT